jgi:hypothetical protein
MRIDMAFLLVAVSFPAFAANGIDVTRGGDSNVYGNCVPSLVVENRSGETIDYLQVDVVLTLRNGRQRTVELKSGLSRGRARSHRAGGQGDPQPASRHVPGSGRAVRRGQRKTGFAHNLRDGSWHGMCIFG